MKSQSRSSENAITILIGQFTIVRYFSSYESQITIFGSNIQRSYGILHGIFIVRYFSSYGIFHRASHQIGVGATKDWRRCDKEASCPSIYSQEYPRPVILGPPYIHNWTMYQKTRSKSHMHLFRASIGNQGRIQDRNRLLVRGFHISIYNQDRNQDQIVTVCWFGVSIFPYITKIGTKIGTLSRIACRGSLVRNSACRRSTSTTILMRNIQEQSSNTESETERHFVRVV